MPYDWRTEVPGIVSRHADGCPVRDGAVCSCGPLSYHAYVWDWEASERRLSPAFDTLAEARTWQRAELAAPEKRPRRAPVPSQRTLPTDEADVSEQMLWWAVKVIGVGFVGVAVALFALDVPV